jgi:hypothetical protein
MAIIPLVINYVGYDEGYTEGDMTAFACGGVIEPVMVLPEVHPPVWDDRPIDGARCMAATRAMCG